jgi:hypothetical protein
VCDPNVGQITCITNNDIEGRDRPILFGKI